MLNFKLFLFAFFFAAAFLPSQAKANTYDEAVSNYQQADFKNCVKNSRAAMKANATSTEKAKILKVMGICQFMIKNKSSASIAFRNALKFDPNTVISEDEVLDTEVIGFFNQEKANFASEAAAKPDAAPKSSGSYAKAPKKTTIQVNSNVSGKVSIEGIYAGVTGSPIDADGGTTQITVAADGFRSRTLKVNVAENKENLVTINLVKPKPKKKRPATPSAVASEKRPKKTKTRPNDELFANEDEQLLPDRDLPGEFDSETSMSASPPPATPPAYNPNPAPTSGVASSDYGSGGANDGYTPPPRRKKPKKGKKGPRTAKSSSNIMITLLPFGAGQFQNGHTTMGSIFLASEAGALIYWYLQKQQADSFYEEARTNRDIIGKGGQEGCTTPQQIEECQITYLAKVQPTIDAEYNKAAYALWGFGALWVAGVIEAMVNEPRSSRGAEIKNDNDALAWTQNKNSSPYWDVDLKLDPLTLKPTYGLGVRIDY